MQKMSKREGFEKLNQRWPAFIEEELQNFDYLLHLSDWTIKFLRGMRFLDGVWDNGYMSMWYVDVNLRVAYQGKEYKLTGSMDGEKAVEAVSSLVFIQREASDENLTRVEEGESLSSILDKAGLREFFRTVKS